jgi:transposase-like protein
VAGAEAEAVAIGDGALGLWKTFNKLYVDAGRQRCWVYETANVLNKREKS